MSEFETVILEKSQSGEFIQQNKPLNRAFLFGDGIFETMVYQKGKSFMVIIMNAVNERV
jgi:hypothetical protein